MRQPVYLDYNATTPVDSRVLEVMLPWFNQQFGNAASNTHPYGWAAAEAVQLAREQVAALIGASPEEIFFTSGATEGLNFALKGIMEAYATKGNRLITWATEHKAVLDSAASLAKAGKEVQILPVLPNGLPDLAALEVAAGTVCVCIMLANNETGVIAPVRQIADLAHAAGAIVVCDATQAVGKIPISVNELGVDVLVCSAHKFYGPKGVGAVYLRRRNPRVRPAALLHGGGHEGGMRSGTLNVPGIVGLGAAAALAQREIEADFQRLSALRDRLEMALLTALPGSLVNGGAAPRLGHVSNLSLYFPQAVPGAGQVSFVARFPRIAVAAGSACTSALAQPSHVLTAMGLTEAEAWRSVRFSLGRPTTPEEIEAAIAAIMEI